MPRAGSVLALAAATTVTAAAIAVTPAGAATTTVTGAAVTGESTRPVGGRPAHGCGDRRAVQRALDTLTGTYGLAGAAVEVAGPGCGRWTSASGVADVRTGRPMSAGQRVRIGSTTKTFTATVVLQLAAEGLVELDAPVERYLPGLIRGNGHDGRAITVRGLLRHTSGLPDHVSALDWTRLDTFRFRRFEPREQVAVALALPRPGSAWNYSTTNYVIAGMLIEKVTGHGVTEEVTRRIIRPLGLRGTYWPGGSTRIRGPHPRGYTLVTEAGGDTRRTDVTEFDMSYGGAGGALVSTLADENRFFAALLGGRLLPPVRLAQMVRTVPADPERTWPGARYGLGLFSTPLRCGGRYWGHGGTVPGYDTAGGITADGRRVQLVLNQNIDSAEAHRTMLDAVQAALCGGR
ncbi:serine hydrolase domain-containing protein [Actinomadura alba]